MGFSFLGIMGITELLKDKHIWKAFLAEFLGTLFLVFVGCASCITWGEGSAPTIVQISLAFGVAVASVVQAIGHISGGHVNPAVSVGMVAAGKMKPLRALLYICCQIVGAMCGAAILKSTLPKEIDAANNLGLTLPAKDMDAGQAFGVEFMITFVLVWVIFAVTDENRNDIKGSAPLAIGLSVAACHLAAVRFTGAAMNPARTFGPAVASGIWTEHWVYWIGPCVGGSVAGILYNNAFRATKDTAEPRGEYSYEPCAKTETQELTKGEKEVP